MSFWDSLPPRWLARRTGYSITVLEGMVETGTGQKPRQVCLLTVLMARKERWAGRTPVKRRAWFNDAREIAPAPCYWSTLRCSFLGSAHSIRMLPVKLLELPIYVRQMLAQCCRFFEKLLTGNREKLGRAFESIRIDR